MLWKAGIPGLILGTGRPTSKVPVGETLKGDCRDITTKINRTASTISHSMTNLNQLVETKRSDTRIITEVSVSVTLSLVSAIFLRFRVSIL